MLSKALIILIGCFGINGVCCEDPMDDVVAPIKYLKTIESTNRIECDFLELNYGSIGKIKIGICNSPKPFELQSSEGRVSEKTGTYGDYTRYKVIDLTTQKPISIVFSSSVPPFRTMTIIIQKTGNELIYKIADSIHPANSIAPKNPEIIDGD